MPRESAGGYREIADLGIELIQESARTGAGLHPLVAAAAGDLVRLMNCYYTNLIEGIDTRPISIERAMQTNYAPDTEQRNLQIEARAHVEVQQLIDHGELDGIGLGEELVRRLHREFFRRMPEEMRWVVDKETGDRAEILPGEWRTRDVKVGQGSDPGISGHIPIVSDMVPSFMRRFAEVYDGKSVSASTAAIAAAASHHRLVWIHPFIDGNGRVARLYSHAFLRRWRLGSELWSVSRGLARSIEGYKTHLRRADAPPQKMTDGRGTLSEGNLVDWCRYFLETALDQARFMARLLDTESLSRRFRLFLENENLQPSRPRGSVMAGSMLSGSMSLASEPIDRRTIRLIDHALLHGEVPRAIVPDLLGLTERQARRLVLPLENRKIFWSSGRHAPYRLQFPIAECELLFPRLFAPAEMALTATPSGDAAEEPVPASSSGPSI
ncbi:MAG: Fic family protein [Rhodospirillaceae bacterium]|nr:Fic family protein [Rhodospirillaceae bacterium]